MSNVIIASPIYSDVGVLYTPSFGIDGQWKGTLPLSNLQSRYLHAVARSESANPADTRLSVDLKTDRAVRVIAVPKHTLSSAAKWKVIGRPSTLAFAYVAGEDIFARGGVFARVPTANVKAASYIDAAGVLRYAGENRAVQSEAFGTTWVASNVTVTSNTVAAPNGATVADTLTASAGNGTVIQDCGVLSSTAFTFSVWLKRKTGTGNIDLTLDNGGTWTTVAVTSDWVRYSVTQTVANPDVGIRIVTNADAVYAFGAQLNMGSTADPYIPTTTAACGAPRDDHWISDERTLLLEAAATNLCLQSENFGTTWTAVGTPTRSAAAHTASGVTLDLLGDDDAAAAEGYYQPITFTADAVKAVALFVKVGSSTSSIIQVYDVTAGANRLNAILTWSGSVPSVAIGGGNGTYLGYEALADGVYRLLFSTASVTAANTNRIYVYPAAGSGPTTAPTGTLYAGGVQAENAVVPSSYIPTTTATVTRAADSLYFPFTTTPQELTIYVKMVERGTVRGSASQRVIEIGNGSDPRLILGQFSGGGVYGFANRNAAAAQVLVTLGAAPTVGQSLELRATLAATGSVQLHQSIASAAETSTSASATQTLDAAFSAERIYLAGPTNTGINAIAKVAVSTSTKTMAECRELISDSGWLDAWPSGATAETLANLNYALVHVLDADFTARYWSVQIHDPDNSAGTVDLARLIVAGGYEPSVNFSTGAGLETESDSVTTYADGGNAIHDVRPLRRVARFHIENVTESEAWLQAWRTMKMLGPKGQAFLVLHPDADDFTMVETAFLCVPREQTKLEYPYALYRNLAFAFTEEL